MSTVLLYTSPARGHLYPMVDVALALREAGHRVVVQTLGDEAGTLEALGLEHRAIAPEIEAAKMEDFKGSNPLQQLLLGMDAWLARAPHELADLAAAKEELHPDLVIVDANSWGAATWAEAWGGPWAMFLPYCLPTTSRDAPAFGPGLPPPRSWLGRTRDSLIRTVTDLVLRGRIGRIDALRAELGVPPLGELGALYVRAPVTLYRTAEPFEYPRSDWPSSVQPLGPGLWAPPGAVPEWLSTLPHPRILVGVSTELQEDGAIIEAAIAGLGDGPGSLIITTAALAPEAFTAPNDRVRITRFLPHAEVIPEVDLVITHGGMGTTQRALAAGVPVCVVPWGRDQSESAQRVVECGAGVRLARGRLSPERLHAAAHQALAYKPAAEAVARAFAAAGGAPRAVELLEGLLPPLTGLPPALPPRPPASPSAALTDP